MMKTPAIALALVAIFAGCTSTSDPAATQDNGLLLSASAATDPDAPSPEGATSPAMAVGAIHLLANGSLALEPATENGRIAVDVPVNGPMWTDGDYPTWARTFDHDLVLNGTYPVRVFATTTSATVHGGTIPVFEGLPAISFEVNVGHEEWEFDLEGPQVIHPGETVEFKGVAEWTEPVVVPAGTALVVNLPMYYLHTILVQEFAYLVGPDHPSAMG